MSQVEQLTGIKAHTLRVWERRFGFLIPERSETNIRYYTDSQLKKLLNIRILLKNGYRISSINVMSDTEILENVSEILTTYDPDYQDQVGGLILSMVEMDEDAFNRIFNNQVFYLGLLKTMTELIYPFLKFIGGLWINNKAFPGQEHFISNLIRQKIIAAIDAIPTPSIHSPRLLLFLVEGENHEIGLLLSYYIAKKMGYRVYYLGQNVPMVDIPISVEIVKADLLFTIFGISKSSDIEDILSYLLENTDKPLLVSGSPDQLRSLKPNVGIIALSRPQDYMDYLRNYMDLFAKKQ